MKKWKKLVVEANNLVEKSERSIYYVEKLKSKLIKKDSSYVSPSGHKQSNYSQSVMSKKSPRRQSDGNTNHNSLRLPKIQDKLMNKSTKRVMPFNDYKETNETM